MPLENGSRLGPFEITAEIVVLNWVEELKRMLSNP